MAYKLHVIFGKGYGKMKKAIHILIIGFFALGMLAPSGSAQHWRDQHELPEKLLDIAGIEPGMTIGEAGAGDGYLTFHISRRIGEGGRVYANDINMNALRRLDARCEREGVTNISTILGEVDDPKFPVNDLDLVIMLYAFHDFTEKTAWLKNVRKYMKPDASIYIFDAQDRHTRLDRETVDRLAKAAGFILTRHEHLHGRVWLYELHVN